MMKNKIYAVYNAFSNNNVNLSFFVKINELKNNVMLIIGENEFYKNDIESYIITNGNNLFHIYQEERADIVHTREQELNKDKVTKEHPTTEDIKNWKYCDYTEKEIDDMVMERIEKIIILKICSIVKNYSKLQHFKIVDTEENVLLSNIL